VKLTVDGRSYTQPITVKQDPRVKTPAPVMRRVYDLTQAMYFGAREAEEAAMRLARVREQIAAIAPKAEGPLAAELMAFAKRAEALHGVQLDEGGGRGRGGRGAALPAGRGRAASGAQIAAETLWGVISGPASLGALMNSLQAADVAPTRNAENAIAAAQAAAARVMARWRTLRTVELPALNAKLEQTGLPAVRIE
jgi:hypothetical protein